MWQKLNKPAFKVQRKKFLCTVAGLGIIGLLLIGCGSGTAGMATSNTASGGSYNGGTSNQSAVPQSTPAADHKSNYGPQYLVKTLQVTMEVQNTMQSASEIQQWVAFTAPQSTSDGSDYENTGNGQYTVTLTFLVDVAHYTQVEAYLRDYAGQKGRTLDSLKETVQDVTNDYVDTESTLTNLRAEQQRLLSFMSQAQNLSDAVNIEQQLTQVEGQINQIEAHLNALKGQTSFYVVTVTVQPVGSAPPPPPPPSPWSVIPIWQGAWSSVVAVGQGLAAVLVWLLAYCVYIIPAGILVWLIRKQPWKKRGLPQVKSAVSFAASPRPLMPVYTPEPVQPVRASTPPSEAARPVVETTAPTHPVAVPPDPSELARTDSE